MKLRRTKELPEPSRRRPAGGRSAPQAFSYYSQRSQSIDRNRRREPQSNMTPPRVNRSEVWKLARQKFGLLIVAAVTVVCLVNLLRLSADPKIESLNAPGQQYLLHSQADYHAWAQQYLADSLFSGSKLTVSTEKFNTAMLKQFPELISVQMALPLTGHRPVVYLRTADPAFILVGSGGQSYVIDESGKALAPSTTVEHLNALHLPVIKDESGINLEQSKSVLSGSAVAFVQIVLKQLQASNVSVNRLVLPAAASELDVYPAGVSYYVKFNLQSDLPAQEAGTYIATAHKLSEQGITPSQYVDVRVEGRAYYQ
jgi:hypothetical protein